MAMMCQTITEGDLSRYSDGNWIAEPKLDGSRITYEYGKIYTTDRFSFAKSRDVTYKFPELKHSPVNAILDGEMLAESGSFEDTGSRIHLEDTLLIRISAKKNPVIFWVFDIIEINHTPCGHLPLWQRKELLKSIKFDNPRFELVEGTMDIQKIWEEIKAKNSEGIVLKNKTSTYENKRSYSWLKCKNWKEDVVLVSGYDENPKGLALHMSNGQRLQCSGGQSYEVKKLLDEIGSARVEIQYLSYDEKAGSKTGEKVYRFPSFKRLVVARE